MRLIVTENGETKVLEGEELWKYFYKQLRKDHNALQDRLGQLYGSLGDIMEEIYSLMDEKTKEKYHGH
jgi:hypothetical protein